MDINKVQTLIEQLTEKQPVNTGVIKEGLVNTLQVQTCQETILEAIATLIPALSLCANCPLSDCEILYQALQIAISFREFNCAQCILQLAQTNCTCTLNPSFTDSTPVPVSNITINGSSTSGEAFITIQPRSTTCGVTTFVYNFTDSAGLNSFTYTALNPTLTCFTALPYQAALSATQGTLVLNGVTSSGVFLLTLGKSMNSYTLDIGDPTSSVFIEALDEPLSFSTIPCSATSNQLEQKITKNNLYDGGLHQEEIRRFIDKWPPIQGNTHATITQDQTCQGLLLQALTTLFQALRICNCQPLTNCQILLRAALIAFESQNCECAQCLVQLANLTCQGDTRCTCSVAVKDTQQNVPAVINSNTIQPPPSTQSFLQLNACSSCQTDPLDNMLNYSFSQQERPNSSFQLQIIGPLLQTDCSNFDFTAKTGTIVVSGAKATGITFTGQIVGSFTLTFTLTETTCTYSFNFTSTEPDLPYTFLVTNVPLTSCNELIIFQCP